MSYRCRGVTLVEMLVSMLMTIVIAGALFSIFTNTYASRDFAVGQGTAETDARTPLDNLADHLRDAQQYHTVEPPATVAQSSVIAAGTATSVTYYETNSVTGKVTSSDTVRLWLSGTNLNRTEAGTTTTILTDVKSLALTYYKVTADANGKYNYNNPSVTQTADPPVAGDYPYITQINIDATVNNGGYQRELTSVVRLRNSPYKLSL